MHRNVCNTHQFHDVDELKQRFMKVWDGLGQSVTNAMDEWHRHLWEIHASLVANLPLSLTVKEFLKSANISQSYERISSGTFFGPRCIN